MTQHLHVSNQNVRIHCAHAGNGDPILFLHGFPERWEMWTRQIEHFSKSHKAIAIDLRGYNLSDKPHDTADYSGDHIIQDIKCVIEHFGGKPVILVGHDWGGKFACLFAHAHPQLVRKLILINGWNHIHFKEVLKKYTSQRLAIQYTKVLAVMERSPKNYEKVCKAVFETTFTTLVEKGIMTLEEALSYCAFWNDPGALYSMSQFYRSNTLGSVGKDWDGSLRVPTRIIWGEEDLYLTIYNIEGLEKKIPDLKITRLHGVSHWVVQELGEKLNDLLEKQIKE